MTLDPQPPVPDQPQGSAPAGPQGSAPARPEPPVPDEAQASTVAAAVEPPQPAPTVEPRRPRRTGPLIALVAVLVLAVATAVALGNGVIGGPGATASPAASVQGVVPSDSAVVAEGRAVPVRWVELGPMAAGEVESTVSQGAAVKTGDPLLTLDTAAADADVAAAKGSLLAATEAITGSEAALAQAKAAVTAAGSGVDQAAAGRKSAVAARDELPSGASSASKRQADAEVLRATAGIAQAKAQRTSAIAGVDAATSAVAQAKANRARAQAGLDAAETARDLLIVRAPFAGTVVSVVPAVGDRVVPGVVAVRIADLTDWRFETTDLSETSVARVRVGAPVKVTVDGLPGAEIAGTVESVGTYGETRQGDIVFKVVVAPTGAVPEGLRWNMTVTLEIQGANAGG
jgi:multidrug resistance efflux pump